MDHVSYELLDEHRIARIALDRPDKRNAQGRRMLYELNDAFTEAARDDSVKVIILAGNGPHFSSGHDLRDTESYRPAPLFTEGAWDRPGAEGAMAQENEIYFSMCRRWHDIPKPTIAQVHGRTIAGGLMVMWVCDLVVASEDATFSDPTVSHGVNGVEWFCHPWELGIRKAKEMLFTGADISATDAHRLGMVNHVVPVAELTAFTTELARTIASRPAFALKLAKLAVNQTLDAQGFWSAQQAAFGLQHVGHAHGREMSVRRRLAVAEDSGTTPGDSS